MQRLRTRHEHINLRRLGLDVVLDLVEIDIGTVHVFISVSRSYSRPPKRKRGGGAKTKELSGLIGPKGLPELESLAIRGIHRRPIGA
jgi:hypothetical protein